jgi:peptidoglycan/LPS O-acetylase OafA/YrhL
MKRPSHANAPARHVAAPAAGAPSTLDALTGLRGVAAMWVLAFHLRHVSVSLFSGRDGFATRLADAGLLGVDLFFVLSGFVLGWTWLERFRSPTFATFGRFVALRLARLWPVHLALLAVLATVVVFGARVGVRVRPPEAFRAGDLVQQLLLVHAFGASRPAWNVVSWSISAEWAAYLAFPAIAALVVRLRTPRAALGTAALALLVGELGRAWLHRGAIDLAYHGALLRVGGPVVAGVALARVRVLRVERARGLGVDAPAAARAGRLARAAAIVVASVVVVLLGVRGPTPLVIPLFAILVYALAAIPAARAGLLGASPMQRLGELSYSLYMVQGVSVFALGKLAAVDRFVGAPLSARLSVLAVHLFGTIALAIALRTLVEEPARKALRRAPERPREAPARPRAPIGAEVVEEGPT